MTSEIKAMENFISTVQSNQRESIEKSFQEKLENDPNLSDTRNRYEIKKIQAFAIIAKSQLSGEPLSSGEKLRIHRLFIQCIVLENN